MERTRDRRKVWWAVLISIGLHLLIGLGLAAFGRSDPALVQEKEDESPVQLTMMDLPEPTPPPTPPPVTPKNTLTTNVDPDRASSVAPKEKTFEANANSIAAAERAAEKDNFLPGQDGKDRPFMNLDTHQQTFAQDGSAPKKPTQAPTAPPKPSPTPENSVAPTPTPEPERDQLALLTKTPTPIPSPPSTEEKTDVPTPTETPIPTPEESKPPAPSSAYRDLQQQTIIRGGINNRGRSAVNALGTPLGRYRKQLEDAIGARWYFLINERVDLASIGTTSITFRIAADGSISHMRILENTTNEAAAGIALRSIQETKFPSIPEELLPTLPDGYFTMEESFTIFGN